jgi:acyl-CoA reductase-like NAD-dependent aldehyde dehydrogenase
MSRLTVAKTYKLYIGGKFPRTESGRSIVVEDVKGKVAAHICHSSRKDFREAVECATKAFDSWSGIAGYLRGQIMYRMAEMLEGRREEFAAAIQVTQDVTISVARKEVDASVDCLIRFAGWTDKLPQVLGCANPVAGNYYNFTVPQPQGVVAVIAPIPTAVFGEVCQTSDVPAGVINLLTGSQSELLEHIATHRQVAGIYAAALGKKNRTMIESGSADSLKRVRFTTLLGDEWYDGSQVASPWNIEPFVEMKTIWHPSAC